MPGYTQVRHNSHATMYRSEIRTLNFPQCDWCGCTNARGNLFAYWVEQHGIYTRKRPIKGNFCSIGCMRSYHNTEE